MDSSKDGKWLLATTETCLDLFATFSGDVDGYQQGLRKTRPDVIKFKLPEGILSDSESQEEFKLLPAVFGS